MRVTFSLCGSELITLIKKGVVTARAGEYCALLIERPLWNSRPPRLKFHSRHANEPVAVVAATPTRFTRVLQHLFAFFFFLSLFCGFLEGRFSVRKQLVSLESCGRPGFSSPPSSAALSLSRPRRSSVAAVTVHDTGARSKYEVGVISSLLAPVIAIHSGEFARRGRFFLHAVPLCARPWWRCLAASGAFPPCRALGRAFHPSLDFRFSFIHPRVKRGAPAVPACIAMHSTVHGRTRSRVCAPPSLLNPEQDTAA